MEERYVILLQHPYGHDARFLLTRKSGGPLLEFPSFSKITRTSNKEAVKNGLEKLLGAGRFNIHRIAYVIHQEPRKLYALSIYSVIVDHIPEQLALGNNHEWLSRKEINERSAQMSALMQLAIVPCLEDESAWPTRSV